MITFLAPAMSTILPKDVGAAPPVYDDKEERSSLSKVSVGDVAPLAAPEDTPVTLFSRRKRTYDLDSVATQPSVFDDPLTLEVYRPPPQYENTHRFDHLARWTWREESVC